MWLKYLSEWKPFFEQESKKPYFIKLVSTIQKEYQTKTCYPAQENILALFNTITPSKIKVVIIGQDPYHNKGQANGLSFSVNDGVKLPPSLVNIFKELQKDLNIDHFESGNLIGWVKQGVFLYNTICTVVEKSPLSHKDIGWLEFSTNLLIYLNEIRDDIIYVLWGSYAQNFAPYIKNKDNIIKGAHPSPFSYHLFKDQHFFQQINALLIKNKKKSIDWKM
ncbi:uracil-DNA glycosylase [Spiroplasma sp. DGKH1]|uniref:uracil-DNA glycosylase n=1 Tax=Spiroplasma sp. DGKH1 TaxID=3050074 RepID=UPI0034C6AA39